MSDDSAVTCQCGCYLFLFLLNLLMGGWSVNYLLMFFAGKVIPFFWATVIGLFAGEISIPVAIVIWILRFCGVL